MTEFPIMPLATDSFGADTAMMTTIEVGAYALLMIAMWRAGGALPNDDKRLARCAHVTAAQWRRIKPALFEKFHVERDVVTSNEILRMIAAVRRRSQSAKHSADARWLKTKGSADASALRLQSVRNANQIRKKTSYSEAAARKGMREDPEAAVSAALLSSKIVTYVR